MYIQSLCGFFKGLQTRTLIHEQDRIHPWKRHWLDLVTCGWMYRSIYLYLSFFLSFGLFPYLLIISVGLSIQYLYIMNISDVGKMSFIIPGHRWAFGNDHTWNDQCQPYFHIHIRTIPLPVQDEAVYEEPTQQLQLGTLIGTRPLDEGGVAV